MKISKNLNAVDPTKIYRLQATRITFTGGDGTSEHSQFGTTRAFIEYLVEGYGGVEFDIKVARLARGGFGANTYEATPEWADFWRAACRDKRKADDVPVGTPYTLSERLDEISAPTHVDMNAGERQLLPLWLTEAVVMERLLSQRDATKPAKAA